MFKFYCVLAIIALAFVAAHAKPVENAAVEDTVNDDLETAQQFFGGYNGFGGGFGGYNGGFGGYHGHHGGHHGGFGGHSGGYGSFESGSHEHRYFG